VTRSRARSRAAVAASAAAAAAPGRPCARAAGRPSLRARPRAATRVTSLVAARIGRISGGCDSASLLCKPGFFFLGPGCQTMREQIRNTNKKTKNEKKPRVSIH
jgi:hypothetical protein